MRFEDTLKVLRIADGSSSSTSSTSSDEGGEDGYDENYNPTEAKREWVDFSKCFLSFNSSAQKIRLNDGQEYVYSYYVIAPLKKDLYDILPKEGDRVWVTKADGTVDKEMEVKGFVTYKKRYLKIWL